MRRVRIGTWGSWGSWAHRWAHRPLCGAVAWRRHAQEQEKRAVTTAAAAEAGPGQARAERLPRSPSLRSVASIDSLDGLCLICMAETCQAEARRRNTKNMRALAAWRAARSPHEGLANGNRNGDGDGSDSSDGGGAGVARQITCTGDHAEAGAAAAVAAGMQSGNTSTGKGQATGDSSNSNSNRSNSNSTDPAASARFPCHGGLLCAACEAKCDRCPYCRAAPALDAAKLRRASSEGGGAPLAYPILLRPRFNDRYGSNSVNGDLYPVHGDSDSDSDSLDAYRLEGEMIAARRAARRVARLTAQWPSDQQIIRARTVRTGGARASNDESRGRCVTGATFLAAAATGLCGAVLGTLGRGIKASPCGDACCWCKDCGCDTAGTCWQAACCATLACLECCQDAAHCVHCARCTR